MSYAAIADRLRQGRLVLLDGGIGTEILRRNVSWADHQLADRPELVRAIHEDYIRAGADVISTNSFQLCRRAFRDHFRDEAHQRLIGAPDLDQRADRLLEAAVALAAEARARTAGNRPVAIAAAVTTLEWCFRPDLAPPPEQAAQEYAETFAVVRRAGADLVLLETVNSIREAAIAAEQARRAGLPVWVSFVCDEDGRLFTGETLGEAARVLQPLGVDALLLNCAPPPDITRGLEELAPSAQVPFGAYPHIGRFDPPEWMFTDEYPPERLREIASGWYRKGARILGGCCGTTPAHIAALRTLG